jgi:hypothetical protein
MPTTPDPTDPHPRGRVPVLDTEMSYASVGEGIRSSSYMATRRPLTSGAISYRMCAAWDGALPPIWWVWDAQDHRPIALIGSWTTPAILTLGSRR